MKHAFTLVELLVVIGLVGVLSAGLVGYIGRGPGQSSRDAKRKADLEQIRSSLEKYRANAARYPACTSGCNPSTLSSFIGTVPLDPLASQSYGYVSFATGVTCGNGAAPACTGYAICARLEKQTSVIGTPVGTAFPTCNYWLRNP